MSPVGAARVRLRAKGALRVVFAGAYTLLHAQAFRGSSAFRKTPTTFSALEMAAGSPGLLIDSHLHVWGDGKAPFPYAEGQDPPERLRSTSGPERLLEEMATAGVDGALIVQPINYKYDHSFVLDTLKKWPGRFKGMCLANPSLGPNEACVELERLHSQGFCGVRFNPYLWPQEGNGMGDETGLALYRKAGDLGMPVGVMCFKGLRLHLEEIQTLLEASPHTKLVIDHLGFFLQGGEIDEDAWQELLALARFPQVYVKISALFRVSKEAYPYSDLRPRVEALLREFGSKRLLWGSDFPFVSDGQCGYGPAKQAICDEMGLVGGELDDVLGKTSQLLFGTWNLHNR